MNFGFLAQAAEPDGIAPPVDLFPYPPWMVASAAVVAALLLAVIVWLVVRWLQRRPAPPPPLPAEIALRELEAARAQLETLDPYAFSIVVSDILRTYLTAQYGLRATQQTSQEFLNSLQNFPRFTAMEKSVLAEFLERCDLLKFARAEGTRDDSAALLDQAIRFVKGGAA